ncbi:MAG: hypothetical protein IT198_14675 [Acidimicrobiia bacterium]|nr:hypothetical protein [Acidimicrobiia bacterium]
MDRGAALDRLPLFYAVAVRLRDAGAGTELIAAGLGVEPEAVPALLEVAESKLASLEPVGQEDMRWMQLR